MSHNASYYLKTGSLILLILIIFGYSFYQARDIIFGPRITLTSPLDGETYTTALIDVSGVATNVNSLLMDDRPIFTDKNGTFDEKLLLLPGYNIIDIEGQDKFGKKTEKIIQVILKDTHQSTNVTNATNSLATSTATTTVSQ